MVIIAKFSFWIMKPNKKSIITELPHKAVEPFEQLILDAFAQFRTEGYMEKLKTSITQESLPSNKKKLLEFLYNQIA